MKLRSIILASLLAVAPSLFAAETREVRTTELVYTFEQIEGLKASVRRAIDNSNMLAHLIPEASGAMRARVDALRQYLYYIESFQPVAVTVVHTTTAPAPAPAASTSVLRPTPTFNTSRR